MSATDPIVDHRPSLRVDVRTSVVVVDDERTGATVVEVTNLDRVIRSYEVAVLGLDAEWVTIEPAVVDLFPDERAEVDLTVRLPETYPAGRRTISVRVTDAEDPRPTRAVVADVVVELAPVLGMSLRTEPSTIEIRRSGSFLLHLTNTGNTPLAPQLRIEDPERLVRTAFDPPDPVVPPGGRAVVRADVAAPRPWLGDPAVRVLTITATQDEVQPIAVVAMVQSPRISRRLIAFLGLLLVISIFALTISLSFRAIAAENDRNAELVEQQLGLDEPAGGRIGPASFTGTITSTTGGGIDGATVELFEQGNALQPLLTTVTDPSGTYRFPTVPAGTYLLHTSVAGFGQAWFPNSPDVADAEPIDVEDGAALEDFAIVLTGQPGSVTGVVLGDDVEGTIVTVQLPATSVEGSDLEPVAAGVQVQEVDATGQFVFAALTTPATYEIRVQKPGFAEEVRTITLGAGQDRENVEILLGRGIGVITGTVVDTAGQPLDGIDVVASDGTSESRTRSLSDETDPGRFELRDLTAPGTYTLTFTAPGYFPETTTVSLGEDGAGEVTVVMTADTGTLAGTVTDAAGQPLGGIAVTVVGGDVERGTRTISSGTPDGLGRWVVEGLPVPGTYTVTFSSATVTTNAVSVELVAGAGAVRTDVDARLQAALATVRGLVTNTDGDPIGGVAVTLEGTDLQRTTTSSDDPAGAYQLDNLPAGVYTITYARAGSAIQTRLVDLGPGADVVVPDVRLEAQAAINGVVTRDGVGVPNVGVSVYRSSEYPDRTAAFTTTDQNGVFTVPGLDAPETYIIEFEVPAGGEVVASRVVQLRPGDTVFLEVEL